jgi:hypothetical protein
MPTPSSTPCWTEFFWAIPTVLVASMLTFGPLVLLLAILSGRL